MHQLGFDWLQIESGDGIQDVIGIHGFTSL
jgi:hypothetical protein